MIDWEPIETAPKDGTTVLLYRRMENMGWNVFGYGYYEDHGGGIKGWISYGLNDPPGNLGLAHPSHWSPLNRPEISKHEAIKTAIGDAVSIVNMSKDENVRIKAAHIADQLIATTNPPDL